MATRPVTPGSRMSAWPPIEWTDRSNITYRLSAHPMTNNELRFDIETFDPNGPSGTDLCTNLTPRTAAEIKKRLEDYLRFMADKAVT